MYYVEHECHSALSASPGQRHMANKKVHHAKYMVRMYYIGDLSLSRADVNKFAYMTDGVGAGGPNAYVNCPLCGSEGRISPDDGNFVDLRESFGRTEITESPFK